MANNLTRTISLRLIVLLLFVPLLLLDANAQDHISIIPGPRELKATGQNFPLDKNAHIVLADPRSSDDKFATDDFVSDVKSTANVSLKISRSRGRRAIILGLLTLPAIQQSLKASAFDVPTTINEEGYLLSVTPESVVIAGASPAGVFYGLQTLKQLVRGEGSTAYIQGVRIIDWPAMRWRGVSDDISRGPIPTVNYIKRQVGSSRVDLQACKLEYSIVSPK